MENIFLCRKFSFFLTLIFLLSFSLLSFSEDKYSTEIVPKLTDAEMQDAPFLYDATVYPEWGVPCTNFTYRVVYSDTQGRPPSYVRIWHNGQWHDMQKASGNYDAGARYEYSFVPNSGKQNFYYFEASNGIGKARAGIIDSPNQGPLMYAQKFDSNQIILLKKDSNTPVWTYHTGKDIPTDVALSKDGKYLAALTSDAIYLFSTASSTPLWKFCLSCGEPPMPLQGAGGIAISSDGKYISAALRDGLYFFGKDSNISNWSANIESNAIGIDMSDDGKYIALGTGDKALLFSNEGELLLSYKPEHPGYSQSGNFYRPDMTSNGEYFATTTGCPDRRAYLFSKNGTLLFRSEQLTEDSPVHKSAISDNANYIAYSLDHSTGKEIVMLFSKSGTKLWGFSSQEDGTARAVSISADGQYIAAGTTAGHIYLFSKNSAIPLWKFSATSATQLNHIGDMKFSSDGNYLVGGGTARKLYLFSKASAAPLWEYTANEWIGAVDFQGDYIAAVTGMKEFAFEGNEIGETPVTCNSIIQPPSREEVERFYSMGSGGAGANAQCGNSICEPDGGETLETCPSDCAGGGNVPFLHDCGDGICGTDETADNCNLDCFGGGENGAPANCGNGMCEMGENAQNCPLDCIGGGNGSPQGIINTGKYALVCNDEDCVQAVKSGNQSITYSANGTNKTNIPSTNTTNTPAANMTNKTNAPSETPAHEPLSACNNFLEQMLNALLGLFGGGFCS
ncbi:hypothetical protein AUJ17_00785 [Candidatus Micrarchaeota archaeon CG1_02_47_40]|nr:MAG: hypothetical protein AUJ17_00785 [Candidatus Micrarchaeota archaeon CG1_02_47_40]